MRARRRETIREVRGVIMLSDKDTGAYIGTITPDQLQFLIDQLEEETDDDRDYWLNRDMLTVFRDAGADPGLVDLLEGALGRREEMEIVWQESDAASV